MTRILSGDTLIADLIIPLDGNQPLADLVAKYDLQPGGKASLDYTQLKEFNTTLAKSPVTVMPGGSSANMLTTLCKLLGKEIEVKFLGVAGEGEYSKIIRQSLEEAGIMLLPERFPLGHMHPQAAISFVLVFPDGQCTIATHPGNARDILKPAMIAEHLVKNCDILLMQGSLWHKLHHEFPDRLYHLCMKHGRRLWLTLPTQAGLNPVEAEKMLTMIPDASLLLGNEGELTRLYNLPLEKALHELQKIFRTILLTGEKARPSPVGFITLGERGAAAVSSHHIEYIAPMPIESDTIANTLGAGDTAFAGFAAGYLRKLSDAQSGQIAMMLAGEKLRINAPRLPNPIIALKNNSTELAQLLKSA